MRRFVVVGGNAAGMSAASVAKRRDPSLDVVVLEEGSLVSYSACAIPYWVSGAAPGPVERFLSLTPESAAQRGLDVRLRTRAESVDASRRIVEAVTADGRREALHYDVLCLATGSEPVMPFAAERLRGVFVLRHLADGGELRAFIAAEAPRRATIVGGGYVSLEMAEAFLEKGIETTVVLRRPRVLGATFDDDMAASVLGALEARGARVVIALPEGVVGAGGRVAALRTQAGDIPADIVVLATGVRARSRLATMAGCDLAALGAIRVDRHMRTSVPHVYAAGDCATARHALTDRDVYVPLALTANRGGRVVGANVTGDAEEMPPILGTSITKFFDMEIARTGLTEVEASAAGFDCVAPLISDVTTSSYMPGVGEMRVKLVAQRRTGRLLGAQIVGGRGAGKRIDTIATAIHAGLTASQLEAMDLAYAPPFSPVWDPVLIAARMAGREAGR